MDSHPKISPKIKSPKIWSNFSPLKKSILVGFLTMGVYLLVVVLTTPALNPQDAISAAFQLNSIVIVGMSVGVGLQIFLSEKTSFAIPSKQKKYYTVFFGAQRGNRTLTTEAMGF